MDFSMKMFGNVAMEFIKLTKVIFGNIIHKKCRKLKLAKLNVWIFYRSSDCTIFFYKLFCFWTALLMVFVIVWVFYGFNLTNNHSDRYGNFGDLNVSMQGPFSEQWVGGHQHRHLKHILISSRNLYCSW